MYVWNLVYGLNHPQFGQAPVVTIKMQITCVSKILLSRLCKVGSLPRLVSLSYKTLYIIIAKWISYLAYYGLSSLSCHVAVRLGDLFGKSLPVIIQVFKRKHIDSAMLFK